MSSQSAKLRTTHSAAVGRTPAQSEAPKVSGRSAERVSWGWVAAIGVGTWALLAYIVPAVAEILASLAL